jgi:hypothetical protein
MKKMKRMIADLAIITETVTVIVIADMMTTWKILAKS